MMIKLLAIVITACIITGFFHKDTLRRKKYRGICIFDVDDTLSTGTDNYNVVQAFLDRGFAVGVCTAGTYWTPQTLSRQSWFPKNLYDFMRETNFITMNNVASGVLKGRKDVRSYAKIDSRKPRNVDYYGWRKGCTLAENATEFGITNPRDVVMFDDLHRFTKGILAVNPQYRVVCGCKMCHGQLNIDSVHAALQRCRNVKFDLKTMKM